MGIHTGRDERPWMDPSLHRWHHRFRRNVPGVLAPCPHAHPRQASRHPEAHAHLLCHLAGILCCAHPRKPAREERIVGCCVRCHGHGTVHWSRRLYGLQ